MEGVETMYCTATHPMQPNTSGHARGRKLHIAKTDTHTICNMLIDQVLDTSSVQYKHFYNNGKCKICFDAKIKV